MSPGLINVENQPTASVETEHRARCRRCRLILLFAACGVAAFVYDSHLIAALSDAMQSLQQSPIASSHAASPLPPRRTARAAGRLPLDEVHNFSWNFVNESDVLTGRFENRVRLFESRLPYGVERAQALRCLQGRHIVFVGDSLTRAMYSMLVCVSGSF